LSSLRGLRKTSKYNQKIYGRKQNQPKAAATPAGPFKMWVPKSILLALLASNTHQLPPSSTQKHIPALALARAFSDSTVDISTLAAQVQISIESDPPSTSIATVAHAFFDTILVAPSHDASFQLLCRYVEVCFHLPPPICRQMLDPFARVLYDTISHREGDVATRPFEIVALKLMEVAPWTRELAVIYTSSTPQGAVEATVTSLRTPPSTSLASFHDFCLAEGVNEKSGLVYFDL